jgi:hypothetical protein
MSIRSSSRKKAGENADRPVYLSKFVKDAHRLLALGYHRVDPASQADAEEEEITESLANAITDIIEAVGSPRWMERYVVNDEIRLRHPTEGPSNVPESIFKSCM